MNIITDKQIEELLKITDKQIEELLKITDKQIEELLKITDQNIDNTAIVFDNIICNSCGYDGLVNLGDEKCPQCGEEGKLQWKEDQPNEISL